MVAPLGIRPCPFFPIIRLIPISSAKIFSDSCFRADLISFTGCSTIFFTKLSILSMAHLRLTAVGRARSISSAISLNLSKKVVLDFDLMEYAPRARPIAPATPMAGAPRITIFSMAFMTSLYPLHIYQSILDGIFLWSTILICIPSHSIVGIIIRPLEVDLINSTDPSMRIGFFSVL